MKFYRSYCYENPCDYVKGNALFCEVPMKQLLELQYAEKLKSARRRKMNPSCPIGNEQDRQTKNREKRGLIFAIKKI